MVEGPLVSDKKKGTKKNQLVNEESHLLEFMFFVKLCQVFKQGFLFSDVILLERPLEKA